MSIFGPGRLINANAVVDIEAVSSDFDPAGGTVESFPTLVGRGVSVLITQQSGSRSGAYGTDAQMERGTVSGVLDALRSTRTRLKITLFPSRPEMVGAYLRITAAVAHPRGEGGILKERITAQYERLDLPAAQVGE